MQSGIYDILKSVTKDILSHVSVEEILRRTTSVICENLSISVCCIYTYDAPSKLLTIRAATGFKGGLGYRFSPEVGLAGHVFSKHELLNIANPQEHESYKYLEETGEEHFYSYLGVPMMAGDTCVGVLVLQQEQAVPLDENVVDLAMTLASQLAVVVAQEGIVEIFRDHSSAEAPQLPEAEKQKVNHQLKGFAVSGGVSCGEIRVQNHTEIWDAIGKEHCADRELELTRFTKALENAREETTQIQDRAAKIFIESDASIFFAQLMLLEDDNLIGDITYGIDFLGLSAESSVKHSVDKYVNKFLSSKHPQLRERTLDLIDIGMRLVFQLRGQETVESFTGDHKFVLVGNEVMPSDLVRIPLENLLGIVCSHGGRTSHAAILAKSLQIPAVMGVGDAISSITNGRKVLVNGDDGIVIVNPGEDTLSIYSERLTRRHVKLTDAKLKIVTQTLDSERVQLQANICMLSDFRFLNGIKCDGVGLYRSEFMFMMHENFPSENEQYRVYRSIGKLAGKTKVTLRVLDIGGDKPLKYFDLGDDKEPMLGYRSIRILLDNHKIFKPHLRAMMRAAQRGGMRILFPMVAHVEDALAVRKFAEETFIELRKQYGKKFVMPEIGAMVEMPSTVWQLKHVMRHLDFVSIGTNDLIQYTFAVDRCNEKVANYYQPLHPIILSMIKHIVDLCTEMGKSVSICGEITGIERAMPLLIGLGLRELSMPPMLMAANKLTLHKLLASECSELVEKSLQLSTEAEVEALLAEFLSSRNIELHTS